MSKKETNADFYTCIPTPNEIYYAGGIFKVCASTKEVWDFVSEVYTIKYIFQSTFVTIVKNRRCCGRGRNMKTSNEIARR